MREYKFRGKRVDTGEWVYGYLCYLSYKAYIKDDSDKTTNPRRIDGTTADIRMVEVDPATAGQYTGIKERYPQMVVEGKEIYFGDVVRLFGGEYCQGYYEHDQTIVVKSAYDIVAMEESENVQILGNVWDNPELLKEVE